MSDYIFAAKLADLSDDVIIPLDYEDDRIAITKRGSRFFAFGDICPHDGGPLADGTLEPCDGSLCVVCPRHGATFDLFTGKPTFPAAAPIPIYQTKIMGDEVWVQINGDAD